MNILRGGNAPEQRELVTHPKTQTRKKVTAQGLIGGEPIGGYSAPSST